MPCRDRNIGNHRRFNNASAPCLRRISATIQPSPSGSSIGPVSGREHPSASVHVEHRRVQREPAVGRIAIAAPGPERDHAPAFKLGQHTPLGEHGSAGGRVVEYSDELERSQIRAPAFDPERPLPRRGQKPRRPEPLGDMHIQSKPSQSRLGQDHAIERAPERLIQPGLDALWPVLRYGSSCSRRWVRALARSDLTAASDRPITSSISA